MSIKTDHQDSAAQSVSVCHGSLADEPLEDVIAAFAAGEKGITVMPDEKRQIVAWLAESGFNPAAEALTEWPGPAPKTLTQRLREVHELVDWLRHYEVTAAMFGVSIVRCTRHGEDRVAEVVVEESLRLDELVDQLAAHEIGSHGDRN